MPELALSSAGYQDVTQMVGNDNGVMEPGEIWAFTPRVSNSSCDVVAVEVSADFALNAGSAGPIVSAHSSSSSSGTRPTGHSCRPSNESR